MSLLDLARPDLRRFTPYSSARREAAADGVLLNANESPISAADGALAGLNRYPDPQPTGVVNRLAGLYGVAPDRLLVTRGSDEGIDLLLRAFCVAGENAIVTMPPTFGMYRVAAGIQNAGVVEVPLGPAPHFAMDVEAVLAACDTKVRLVFVCSPNNPTGSVVTAEQVAQLCAALDGRALVVLDEAYAEFSESAFGPSLLDQHANLVVLRTLSKAWGLAGARCGALLADAEVIGLLGSIMAPYPLSLPAMRCVEQALDDLGAEQRLRWLIDETRWLAQHLLTLPAILEVYPSEANFVLVRLSDKPAVMAALAREQIVVRDVGKQPGLTDCVRISTGLREENKRLLAVLEDV